MRSAVLCLSASIGCLSPASDRALADLEVGRAQVADARFEVDEGLAAILELSEGSLRLWGSAPAFTLRAHIFAASSWMIQVDNALPDAVFSSPSAVFERRDGRFFVQLDAGAHTLRFGPQGPEDRFRFAVLSDVQEAIDSVQEIYQQINADPTIRFLLGAGDLTENGGEAELTRFKAELQQLNVPYFTTLGNHELGASPPPWHAMFGRASFSFEHAGVRFSMLDSGSATIDALVLEQLQDWLRHGAQQPHVVAMHIPPIDPVGVRNGSFASRAEGAKLLSLLAQGQVDLTLYGHIHSHYAFENAGIEAHISGGGGAIPERFDGIGRHFLVVDASSAGIESVSVVRVD